jgi:hypothetical protein
MEIEDRVMALLGEVLDIDEDEIASDDSLCDLWGHDEEAQAEFGRAFLQEFTTIGVEELSEVDVGNGEGILDAVTECRTVTDLVTLAGRLVEG